MAGIANLTIDQGSNFTYDLEVTNSDGTDFDLTGFTMVAKMSKGYSSTYPRTVFTCTVSQPTEGVVTISLTADQTKSLKAGRHVFDVVATHSDSTVTRLLEGIVIVTPSVVVSF
jgi:hypothetical protein|tara:strand:- start:6059 stop:6400 length:342 start_codon:yes stop_codon:yes gene_type:complete